MFGVAITVALFAAAGGYSSPQQFSDGFVAAMGISAGLSLAGAIAGLVLPSRKANERDRRAVPASPAPDSGA